MSRDRATEDLTEFRRINEDRDTRVRNAFEAGLSKMEIHELSGLGRATIDRILDKASGRAEQRYGVLVAQGGAPGTDGIYVYDGKAARREEQVTGPDNLTRAMALADEMNGIPAAEWKARKTGADGWSTQYTALA